MKPVANVIKLLRPQARNLRNKLECLSPLRLFSLVSKAGVGKVCQEQTLSSLLQKLVPYVRKKLYNIGHWGGLSAKNTFLNVFFQMVFLKLYFMKFVRFLN
jgi:hypothetical protein